MKFAEPLYFRFNTTYYFDILVPPHLPFKLGEEYFYYKHVGIQLQLPWSYKVIAEERNKIPPCAIAVRTDVYPLLWILVLWQYKLEKIGTHIKSQILHSLFQLGLLQLKPGEIPGWRNINLRLWKK